MLSRFTPARAQLSQVSASQAVRVRLERDFRARLQVEPLSDPIDERTNLIG